MLFVQAEMHTHTLEIGTGKFKAYSCRSRHSSVLLYSMERAQESCQGGHREKLVGGVIGCAQGHPSAWVRLVHAAPVQAQDQMQSTQVVP